LSAYGGYGGGFGGCGCGGYGYGGGFALIVVLFILLIIIGATSFYKLKAINFMSLKCKKSPFLGLFRFLSIAPNAKLSNRGDNAWYG
jgi:uncharacterized protein (TIGR01732 family)